MTEFTIDLISNASVHIHPENNLTSFTNELLVPIEFDREYECGIIELFHPALLFSNQEKKTSFQVQINAAAIFGDFELIYKHEDTISDICDQINKIIKSNPEISTIAQMFEKTTLVQLPTIGLIDHENSKKVNITPGFINYESVTGTRMSASMNIVFKDPNFLRLLGFEPADYFLQPIDKSTIIVAKSFYDKRHINNLMFIYCDIVAEHHVGDAMANSLRVVALWKEKEPRVFRTYIY